MPIPRPAGALATVAVALLAATPAPARVAPAAIDSARPVESAARPRADRAALDAWKARRLAALTSETGWLTPIALHWLRPGRTAFGRDAGNGFALDHAALPARAGTFRLRDGRVSFEAARGAAVTVEGRPAKGTVEARPDTGGAPTVFEVGSLQFFVVERSGNYGVRVRDRDSPRRRDFAGLAHFPVADDWVFDARFEPYEPAKTLPIVNILGFEDAEVSPGALVFEKDGREWRLDAILERPDAKELFVIFADGTTGHETYGAGRFLYVPLPADGRVRVDFNRAYNPPCAFNAFSTCPLPPEQNRLPLRVEAGELEYAGGN